MKVLLISIIALWAIVSGLQLWLRYKNDKDIKKIGFPESRKRSE